MPVGRIEPPSSAAIKESFLSTTTFKNAIHIANDQTALLADLSDSQMTRESKSKRSSLMLVGTFGLLFHSAENLIELLD